mmetsp:Transcript_39087/g.98517  ORF Transcript_39087/g.98517 Transcript_39087/m.98517 type:complete len:83 (-) Transcript_39087:109-357(-)
MLVNLRVSVRVFFIRLMADFTSGGGPRADWGFSSSSSGCVLPTLPMLHRKQIKQGAQRTGCAKHRRVSKRACVYVYYVSVCL